MKVLRLRLSFWRSVYRVRISQIFWKCFSGTLWYLYPLKIWWGFWGSSSFWFNASSRRLTYCCIFSKNIILSSGVVRDIWVSYRGGLKSSSNISYIRSYVSSSITVVSNISRSILIYVNFGAISRIRSTTYWSIFGPGFYKLNLSRPSKCIS